ncbi:MAG: hypothetical protein J6X70_07820 [Muribaculaceae bacterium]|nr:hypothetical protein [Muribaculaceae bacterium]
MQTYNNYSQEIHGVNSQLNPSMVWKAELLTLVAVSVLATVLNHQYWLVAVIALLMVAFNYFAPIADSERELSPIDDTPSLYTLNGIGTSMVKAPFSQLSDVRYQFFTIAYMPILPLDCYWASKTHSDTELMGWSSCYRIGGRLNMNALELLNIYLVWWSPVVLFVSLIAASV